MPKFTAHLEMLFTELDFLDRFKAAADAGFEAVEFLFPYKYSPDTLLKTLTDTKLELVLFNTWCGQAEKGEWGLTVLPNRIQEARSNIDSAIHYATFLGCKKIHAMAGIIPHDISPEICEQTYIENIRYAADQAAPYGITIMIEALSPHIRPHYLFSSQYKAIALADTIARQNVQLQFDIFHAQMVDGHITHLLKTLQGRYGHIQIASVPERHEPCDGPQGGEINYAYIFNLLDEIGYTGWVGAEYIPTGNTIEGLGWVKPYLSQRVKSPSFT